MALPRSARLRAGSDIRAVSQHGSRARAADVSVALRRGSGRTRRAAVVVGKGAGNAVVRNRIRRRAQHVLADLLDTVPAGTELVVRCGSKVSTSSTAALSRDLRSALRRAAERATG